MANEIEFYSGNTSYSGSNLIARVFTKGEKQGADIPMSEVEDSGNFLASMPSGLSESKYTIIIFDDSENIVSYGHINWDGTKEIVISTPEINNLSYTISKDVKTEITQEQPLLYKITEFFKQKYKREGLTYKIQLNSNTIVSLKEELSIDPTDSLTVISVLGYPLNIQTNNSLPNGEFNIFGNA